ncbi:MAG: tetratricopeptide repeat protein [Streptosporangiaceae bacterium]|nr:tetratricopeptide repeat protein [Streptosporangiaceae bacterium]
MWFEILGPMRVTDQDMTLSVSGVRQRTVLGALLAHANRPVPGEQLAEIVWDGGPPPGAVATLRTYVMRLRRGLGSQGASRIVTRDAGYLVEISDDELDARVFETLCHDTGTAIRAHAWSEAAVTAARALALWRGTPLVDVLSQRLRDSWTPHLDQHRLQAVEWHIEAELHLDRPEHLVSQLRDLITQHPLRERFHAQLMLALACSGRQAEALAAYQNARQVLVDQVGIEPGPELRNLQERILAGDAGLLASPRDGTLPGPVPAAAAVPHQLPAAPRLFTGRASELALLTVALDGRAASSATPVISAIGGASGIGKTWLALHWAHQNLDRFPDGQLYVNLRGFDPSGQPMPAQTAIRGFLDALGVDPAAVPADTAAQAGLYRSIVAGKRMLIVADNAREADQVIPLLPGSPGCAVLVTSRRRLTGLIAAHGAIPVDVNMLGEDEARQVLVRHLGQARVAAEPDAVAELLACCGGLPLALGIVAARALARPSLPLATLADELRDTTARLDALAAGDLAANTRAVLSWSYDALDLEAASTLGLLALSPGPDIGLPAAASLTAMPSGRVRTVLRELEDAYLLQQHISGRYRMHDLIRLYATERASHDHTPAEWEAALRRVCDFYTHTAYTADRLLDPHRPPIRLDPAATGTCPLELPGEQAALAWLEDEQPSLLAAQSTAATRHWHPVVWQLAWTLDTFHRRRAHHHDALAAWQAALNAAAHLPDPTTRAVAHRRLASALIDVDRLNEAIEHLYQALALADDHHDPTDQAITHRALAWAWERLGDDRQALHHAIRGLELYQALDQPVGEAHALNAVGWLAARLGDYDTARANCQTALTLHRRHHSPDGEAAALDSLGYVEHHTGHHRQAIRLYQQALTVLRGLGDTYEAAGVLDHLGDPHVALGQYDRARTAWQEAQELYRAQQRDSDAERLQQHLETLPASPPG